MSIPIMLMLQLDMARVSMTVIIMAYLIFMRFDIHMVEPGKIKFHRLMRQARINV